jgi:hypothetical protein
MVLYPATIFISAFLLFQIEPMLAKYILPWFGGAPAVWTTCLLFFQILLLGGYFYAHLIGTRLRPRAQIIVHLGLMSVCVVVMSALALNWRAPILPDAGWKPLSPDFPVSRILTLLTVSIALPYFILSATAPLVQTWFARLNPGVSPWRLYALSNFGSLLALLTYPLAVEPALTLRVQAWVWSALFVMFALGMTLGAAQLWGNANNSGGSKGALPGDDNSGAPPSRTTRGLWVALPACASVMLLAATNQICQGVAAVPFLWILPLALYLLSFIICFDSEQWYVRAVFHPALAFAIFVAAIVLCSTSAGIVTQVVSYAALLFAVCMVCHGELVRLKPGQKHLTAFYLMVAVGGALGGLFTAMVAPYIFDGYWEFQLAIWASALLLFLVLLRDRESWLHEQRPTLAIALFAGVLLMPELISWQTAADTVLQSKAYSYNLTALAGLAVVSLVAYRRGDTALARRPGAFPQISFAIGLLVLGAVLLASINTSLKNSVLATRNFYGALGVIVRDQRDPEWRSYVLRHGKVVHGVEFAARDKRDQPTSYYGPRSGIGLLMLHHPRRSALDPKDRSLRVGIVGLGAGTIAAYGELGDYIRYYEINPAVIAIASDPTGYFTFLRDSRSKIEIVPGDARLSMEQEIANHHSQQFDVLAIDAFSGDAIPVHLLTREAFEVYLHELKTDGVLALHISNTYLDLRPVIRELAEHYGLRWAWVHSTSAGRMSAESDWMLATRNVQLLEQPSVAAGLQPTPPLRKVGLWTDDYSNLFQILK